jgi:glycine/D-amino acid oxidase-like deaminating enzyme
MRAVVIGAGIIGAAVGYRLAQRGVQVTLLEERRPGGGTSGSSFAWVNANGKSPRDYFDLNVAGMREHRSVAEELPNTWFHPGGDLEWADGEAATTRLADKVERLREWGYRVEWRTAAELRELEPDLSPLDDGARVAHYVDESWIDPLPLVGQLLAAARRHGAEVRNGAAVSRVVVTAGRVEAVEAGGGLFAADLFVNCAGPRAGAVAEMAGSSLPMRNSVGLLLTTEPAATTLAHVVHAPGIYFRPEGAGRLMLGSHGADRGEAPRREDAATSPVATEMLAAARRVLPALDGVEIEAARLGTRAIPADGMPAVGWLPGLDNLYAVATHSGITLALLLGRLAANELVGGAVEAALAPLRPSRLLSQG